MKKRAAFFVVMRQVILTAVLALAIIGYRFWGMDQATALWLQYNFSYWTVLAALGWFMWSLKCEADFRFLSIRSFLRGHSVGILIVVACGVFLQIQEPHMLKVLQDEPTHLATSLLIHKQRAVATPAEAHIFDGELIYLHAVPEVRMFLFSTLLSMVHDVSGYRVENVFILNAFLSTLVLALLYVCGNMFAGRNGGCLAVVLMAGVPLLSQVATSGSYDLLNLVLLLGLFISTRHYLLSPAVGGLNLMLSVGVLLALSRYESILYLLIPIGAMLYKWRGEKAVSFTRSAMLSPLAVWPCFTANFIMLSNDGFTLSSYREKGAGFFGLQYFAENARQAVYYLFNFDLDSTNSVLLSTLGLLGLVALWVTWSVRFRRAGAISFETKLLTVVSIFIFVMYLFVLTNFWGRPTQSSATRFILPLYAIMSLAAVWLVRNSSKQKKVTLVSLAAAGLFMMTFTNSSNVRASTTIHMSLPISYKWFLEYARKHDDGRTLYVADSSLYMLVYGYPSIPTSGLNTKLSSAVLCLKAGMYDEILIMDIRYRDPVSGNYTNGLGAPLSSRGQYEVVAEREFAYSQDVRILRLLPRLPKQGDFGADHSPELREKFKSNEERSLYNFNLLP